MGKKHQTERAEELLKRQALVLEMCRTQTLIHRLVTERLKEENEPLETIARRLNSSGVALKRFTDRESAITDRAALLPGLLAYAHGSKAAQTLPTEERNLLARAQTLFDACTKMGDRNWSLTRFPEKVVNLFFMVQETRVRICREYRGWIFAAGFGEQAALVTDLLELKNQALKQLEIPEVADRLLDQLCDAQLIDRVKAAEQASQDELERYAVHARRVRDVLMPSVYKDGGKIASALGEAAHFVNEICNPRNSHTSMEQMRRVFLMLVDLASRHNRPIPEDLLPFIEQERLQATVDVRRMRARPATELRADEDEPEGERNAKEGVGTESSLDLPPREPPSTPPPAPPPDAPPLNTPPTQEPATTVDPLALLRIIDTDILEAELVRRGRQPEPPPPPTRAPKYGISLFERSLTLLGPLVDLVRASVETEQVDRNDLRDMARLCQQILTLIGADKDPTIQHHGLGHLSPEEVFGGRKT